MSSSSEEADQSAMKRLSEGEDLALNEIMQRWKAPLTHYLFRQLGQEQDAVELAQETFVRIYEQRLKYRPKGKFSTWVFTIATTLGRSHRRWQGRHPVVSIHEGEDDVPEGLLGHLASTEPDASGQLRVKERAKRVQLALAELPEDLRTAVVLFEYEDLGYEEIAQVMGCSAKAVETRIYRARALLRETLASLWEEG
jgi:RNA polymerase sigma-70 factor (ECF subfamily)